MTSLHGLAPALSVAAEPLKLLGVKGEDDRNLSETTAYPWTAIGRINRTTGGFCTGSVVGPRLVLTAAHCLWNRKTQRWLPTQSLHFVAGYRRGEYLAHARVVDYELSPGFQLGIAGRGAGSSLDWAILRLTENVTNLTGTLPTAPLTQSQLAVHIRKETSILQAGYSQDKAHILTVHEGCRFTEGGPSGRLIFHTCDAVKGDSGSPILVRNGDRYQLIAIHVATLSTDKETIGVAIPGIAFHATIKNSQSGNK